ncbi:diguanylate cyclase (GGDEF)-like protein [Thermasporomyces composti]|uniref:Diguanylate cyclase (GGDEF)-like protein n=2 Tax=Thermasporomyces composti TaxID=696763 RepID=A0A3D9V3A2_THECX|nr:diguanylate cyclase (GGDEF)-like protein [Thermasporomyces composti]
METGAGGRPREPWRWAIWSLPTRSMAYLLAVDLTAIVALVAVVRDGIDVGSWAVAVALTVCGIVGTEGARRVERRRQSSGALHKDLQPVWTLAAAILLPLSLALVFAVVQSVWWRIRTNRCTPHRWFFSTAVTVLGVVTASTLMSRLVPVLQEAGWADANASGLAMVLAAASYFAIDILLCAIAIFVLVPGSTPRDAFGGPAEWSVDMVAGGLACVVATASTVVPWLALLAIPATLTAQRSLLLRQLEVEVHTDRKTELASFPWWREQTETLLGRVAAADGRLAVLFIDIDDFRKVNANYGHLVGDRALRAVAEAMQRLTRRDGLAGRFGGEEFVVAVPDVDMDRAYEVAERIRAEVANTPLEVCVNGEGSDTVTLRLTVSVGLATYPETAHSLDHLLELADRALRVAKATGKNRTVRADTVNLGGSLATGVALRGAERWERALQS